jgi:hypothetical protein
VRAVTNSGTRSVWCETLSHQELAQATPLLVGRNVEVIVCVQPSTMHTLAAGLSTLTAAGIAYVVWPMLENPDGRWLSNHTAPAFARFLRTVTSTLQAEGMTASYVLDIEPPFAVLSALASRKLPPMPRRVAASAELALWLSEARAQGIPVQTTNMPTQVFGPARAAMDWVFGVPHVAHGKYNVMLYSSMIAGIGGLSRGNTDRVMRAVLRAGKRYAGDRLGVSLGTVGTGAFGDEPCYKSPAELRHDMQICRAHGVHDMALFDLGGIMRSADPEAWIATLVEQ